MTGPLYPQVLGWSEWAALPDFALTGILAKVDTGARSCSLHVEWQRDVIVDGVAGVAFALRDPRDGTVREFRTPVLEYRTVTSSNGQSMQRAFIRTRLQLGAWQRDVDLNLADRGNMTHPMLIGRAALGDSWLVDPSRRFLLGGGPRA